MSDKKVGVVCATYRNPESDSLVREYGVISLVEQMLSQEFDGEVRIAIVDSSPRPHPFLDELSRRLHEKLLYVHLPSRNDLPASFKAGFPKAARFVPSDETLTRAVHDDLSIRAAKGHVLLEGEHKLANGKFDLTSHEWDEIVGKKTPRTSLASVFNYARGGAKATPGSDVEFWRKRIAEVRGFARFVPFEKDYPIQTNILSQIFAARPSIGMKKNVGVQALAEAFGDYDAIIFSDDDDHHGADYVRRNVEALKDADFARMTRYYTHLFGRGDEANRWGVFHLDIRKDDNDYWVLTPSQEDAPMHCLGPDGIFTKTIGGKFSRPVTMAWPILSHEGALHSYAFKAWEKSVEAFGGAVPVSFCEDIIYYRQMKDHFGKGFRDALIPVPRGTEAFIRIADGRNASVIEWSETADAAAMPEWTKTALRHLSAAVEAGPAARAEGVFRMLARQYAQSGSMNVAQAIAEQPRRGPSLSI